MIDAMTTVSESRPGPAKGPGRPRSERAHEAILEATLDLLVEEGFSRMSIEAVATRAGVGKATIYRRWPSKADLVAEAVACMKDHQLSEVDNGNVRDDLFQLGRQSLKGKDNAEVTDVMIKLMSARARHPELQEAFVRQVIEPRRRIVAEVLRRGVARGEIRPDIDVDLAMDVILGLVSYRSMVTARHAGISETSLRRLIDVVLYGIATRQAGGDAAKPAKASAKATAQSRAASSSS
jgi:AcrR family transcriptional regulator